MMIIILESPNYHEMTLPSEELLVRFLMARKFDVDKTLTLIFKFISRFDLKEKFSIHNIMDLMKTQVITLHPIRDKFFFFFFFF